jgi:two-component system, NtrC family, sensor kinase
MKTALIVLLSLAPTILYGQRPAADSIKQLLAQCPPDTNRVLMLVHLAAAYRFYRSDSSLSRAKQAIREAQKLNFSRGESQALNVMGEELRFLGELPQALEAHLNALRLSKKIGDRQEEAIGLAYMGLIYVELKEYRRALLYLQQANKIFKELSIKRLDSYTLSNIGNVYEKMNLLDSSLLCQRQSYTLAKALNVGPLKSLVLSRLGIIYARLNKPEEALAYYRQALQNTHKTHDLLNRCKTQYRIAELYYQLQQRDSSLYYARQAFVNCQWVSQKTVLLSVTSLLVKLYQVSGDLDSAFHYQGVSMAAKDSLFGPEKFKRLQLLALAEQQREQALLQEQARSEQRFQRIGLSAALSCFLLIALLLWRHNRQQQQTNQTLKITLSELTVTQAQLLEKEKMASLYQQQLKIQQVRNKIATELHDDIGSTLSSIHLFSEVAKKEINSTEGSQALPMLEKIKSSSQEMMQSMSEIVWAIQPNNDDTTNLLDKIQSFANDLLSSRSIMFRFEYPDHFHSFPIPMEVRRNIYLIFKETINNIIKHSQATTVDMMVSLEQKEISISVSDNGVGFDKQFPAQGNGLRNLQDRAEEIGGSLLIKSQPDQGTCISLQYRLP